MKYYELTPVEGDAPRLKAQVILHVEDPLDQNAVEKSWVDFVAERIEDRFGGTLDLAWAVEDSRYSWGFVRGTKPGEAARIVKLLEQLREEWAVWPAKKIWHCHSFDCWNLVEEYAPNSFRTYCVEHDPDREMSHV